MGEKRGGQYIYNIEKPLPTILKCWFSHPKGKNLIPTLCSMCSVGFSSNIPFTLCPPLPSFNATIVMATARRKIKQQQQQKSFSLKYFSLKISSIRNIQQQNVVCPSCLHELLQISIRKERKRGKNLLLFFIIFPFSIWGFSLPIPQGSPHHPPFSFFSFLSYAYALSFCLYFFSGTVHLLHCVFMTTT